MPTPTTPDTIAPEDEARTGQDLQQQRTAQRMPSLATGRPHPRGLSSDLRRGPKGAAETSTLRDTPQIGERRNVEDPKTGKQRKETGKESAQNMLGQWRTLQAKLRKAEALREQTRKTQGAEAAQARGKKLKESAQKITGQALKQAWLNLISSWGLTILWIDFHFVMWKAGGPLSDYFTPFGHEWEFLKVRIAQNLWGLVEIVLMFIANAVAVIVLTLIVLIAVIGFCISPVGIPVCGAAMVTIGIQSGAF